MALLETAAEYILGILVQNEEVKKFPKEFLDESVKWVKSWFLKDDSMTTSLITNPALPPEAKKAVVDAKLKTLDDAGQLPAELTARIEAFLEQKKRIKNVMIGGSIDVKKDVHIGDTELGNDTGLTEKNVLKNVTVKTDGGFRLGDGHSNNIN